MTTMHEVRSVEAALLEKIESVPNVRASNAVREVAADHPLPDVRDALWHLLEKHSVARKSDGTLFVPEK